MGRLATVIVIATLLAGCAGGDDEDDDGTPAPQESALPEVAVLLEDCLRIDSYTPLPEEVYDTGEYTSAEPGLAAAAGFQQAVQTHAFACQNAVVDGADAGPLSGAFIAVHIEDVARVHSVRASDFDGVFLPLQTVLSAGAVHDLVAGLGFDVTDGSVQLQGLPPGRLATVDGEASFTMAALSPLEVDETGVNPTSLAVEDMLIGSSGWLSFVADCPTAAGGSAIVIESGTSILQQAGPVLHGTNTQHRLCTMELVFTPY